MEIPSSEPYFGTTPHLFPHHFIPQNYVHWTQTPESHIYSADIPGVRKEDIRVEVEDSIYVIIRTVVESTEEPHRHRRSFNKKFRLPRQVDVTGISAEYVAGVLTVMVPRSFVTRAFFNEAENMRLLLARAA